MVPHAGWLRVEVVMDRRGVWTMCFLLGACGQAPVTEPDADEGLPDLTDPLAPPGVQPPVLSTGGTGGGSDAPPLDGAAGESGALDGDTGEAPYVPGQVGGLDPIAVAPGYEDLSVPLGEPLPAAPPGQWTYVELPGTSCRDGSSAGLFVRYSSTSKNYFVFLEGGGACFDDFFCPLNPQNVNESVDGESILQAAVLNFGGAAKIPQTPRVDGIFKDDPRNPVADWNAVYVPYCSGDVYGGTRDAAPVPRWPAGGNQTFQGYRITDQVAARAVATFPDADKALLTGSSAGGVGSLMNASKFADMLHAHTRTRGFVVSDSGPVFDDEFLETCIQKEWRELWGLNDAFPSDCEGCFNADGGGVVKGLGQYLMQKYPEPGQVLGGIISTQQDEVMTMFYSRGMDNCQGSAFYPVDRYKNGLDNFVNEVVNPDRFSSYFMAGTFHMHLFQPRFYEQNGVGMSIADWLGKLLNNEVAHVAPTP